MILLRLNNGQATAVKGGYRKHANGQDSHACEPVYIENHFWILHEGIEGEEELSEKLPWQALTAFDTEDLGDPNNIIYQAFLASVQPPV